VLQKYSFYTIAQEKETEKKKNNEGCGEVKSIVYNANP
jgi:hypothetical protein